MPVLGTRFRRSKGPCANGLRRGSERPRRGPRIGLKKWILGVGVVTVLCFLFPGNGGLGDIENLQEGQVSDKEYIAPFDFHILKNPEVLERERQAAVDSVLKFDEQETDRRRQQAAAAVPIIQGTVLKDEMIIGRNMRITAEHMDKLRSLAAAMKQKSAGMGSWQKLYLGWGRVLLVSLILSVLVSYLYVYRPKVFQDDSMLLLIAILVVFEALLAYLVSSVRGTGWDLEYLVPVPIFAMLVAILFDTQLAVVGTVTVSLLVGSIGRFHFSATMAAIISGVAGAYSLRQVRHRYQFYWSMLLIPAAYAGTLTAIHLFRMTPPLAVLKDCGLAVLNGVLSPMLTMGALPIFETVFKITTDITLLELSDLNRPLLKRLAMETPGTYHHSIVVGNLAEPAAEAIGANSLLARVGAYYHDIGKLAKPRYFIENLGHGEKNPHDNLTPSMSSLVLEAHVAKDGVELARQEHLPKLILDIIQQHHGTTVMQYFFQKAIGQCEHGNVDEEVYRYPGPKPRTKEAAIVMLADYVDSLSRSLKDLNPNRLTPLVDQVITDRLTQLQLDECDLTLGDLKKIRESFATTLLGIFHRRIEYPKTAATA